MIQDYSLLPVEVWLEIWSNLESKWLAVCMCVNKLWRSEILRLIRRNSSWQNKRRYLLCRRLSYVPGCDALDHRKSVKTSLRFNVNSEIKFQGILIYTGNDKEILGLSEMYISFFLILIFIIRFISSSCVWKSYNRVVFDLWFQCIGYKGKCSFLAFTLILFLLFLQSSITTIQESRRKIRDLDHIIHTDQLLLDLPVTLSR